MAVNHRSPLYLSLACNIGLAAACVCLAYAAFSFYARSLSSALTPAVFERGVASANIVFFGDSRVAQWAEHDQFEARYLGLSGATSLQALGFINTNGTEDFQGKTVVLQFGVNDLRVLGIYPERSTHTVRNVVSNIRAVVESIAQVAKQVIVLTVLPVEEPGLPRSLVWSPAIDNGVGEINRSLLASQFPETVAVLHARQWLEPRLDDAFVDALHFKATAYAALNAGLAERLARAVQ